MNKISLYSDCKKHLLNPITWLFDSEIHAAQLKFPFIDGLVDPVIQGNLVTPAMTEFVQIINTGSRLDLLEQHFMSTRHGQSVRQLFWQPSSEACMQNVELPRREHHCNREQAAP